MTVFYIYLCQFIVSLLMTGVIWTIQRVHYPSFHYIEGVRAYEFHLFHQKKITGVVAPLMLIEFFTAMWLCFFSTDNRSLLFINIIILLFIWIGTFFLSVPLHSRLLLGHQAMLIESLVVTNWLRTVLWTLKSVLLTYGWMIHA